MSKEIAEARLQKVARKLRRLTTPRKLYVPDAKDRPYRAPKKTATYLDECCICGRQTAYGSRRCRECFQGIVREKYETRRSADEKRVRIAVEALNYFERKSG